MLQVPNQIGMPLRGRLGRLQSSFDELVAAGHGARWGDVPGEALISMSDPSAVLRDAWPDLKDDDAAGIQRLVRLVDQRLRGHNSIVDPISIEPMVSLMLEDGEPWLSGQYASNLLRDWLRGHIAARTPTVMSRASCFVNVWRKHVQTRIVASRSDSGLKRRPRCSFRGRHGTAARVRGKPP